MTRAASPDAMTLRRRAEGRLRGRALLGELDHPGRLLHEAQAHQVEPELQNEDLRCALEEAEGLRDRFSDFCDFSPTGFMSLNDRDAILQINLTGARFLGLERAPLVGGHLVTFVDPRGPRTLRGFPGPGLHDRGAALPQGERPGAGPAPPSEFREPQP